MHNASSVRGDVYEDSHPDDESCSLATKCLAKERKKTHSSVIHRRGIHCCSEIRQAAVSLARHLGVLSVRCYVVVCQRECIHIRWYCCSV